MKLLISVRNEAEALLAAAGGADFIDLKEPRDGALGGLPVAEIARIVRRLREASSVPISATIGDLPMSEIERIGEAVRAVAACGVDYVKVGIEPSSEAIPVLELLAHSGLAVIPVFIADRGLDFDLVRRACATANFPALMADTADKRAGSLFDCCSLAGLQAFIEMTRRAGKLAGLAGALRRQDLTLLRRIAPDFAGFRSAVCQGDRSAGLDARLLDALKSQMTDERLAFAV